MKFTGSRCESVAKIDADGITYCECIAHEDTLYFHYKTKTEEHLCALDTEGRRIYEVDAGEIKSLVSAYDNACVVKHNELMSIDGNPEGLPMDFMPDITVSSYIECDEIHNGYKKFTPAKILVRAKIMQQGEISAYCMLGNGGDWKKLFTVNKAGDGLIEAHISSPLTDSMRLKIQGVGDYIIKNIYVIYT